MTTAAAVQLVRDRATWAWFLPPWVAALALYAPLLPWLVHEWAKFPNLSHGFAIPFIAAYLVWSRRDRLRAAAHRALARGDSPLCCRGSRRSWWACSATSRSWPGSLCP